jgi:tryptophan-rich sensory protein
MGDETRAAGKSHIGGQVALHAATGAALGLAAVIVSALIARRHESGAQEAERALRPRGHAFQTPRPLVGAILPPFVLAFTLSGLRLWNAPPSSARTRALSLWTAIQGLNLAWLALGSRRLGGALTAAVAALGASAAYAFAARRVDAPATNLAGPYLGWIGFANVLTEELWRKATPVAPTVH